MILELVQYLVLIQMLGVTLFFCWFILKIISLYREDIEAKRERNHRTIMDLLKAKSLKEYLEKEDKPK